MPQRKTYPKKNREPRRKDSRCIKLSYSDGCVEYFSGISALFALRKRELSVSTTTLYGALQASKGAAIPLDGGLSVERVKLDKTKFEVFSLENARALYLKQVAEEEALLTNKN